MSLRHYLPSLPSRSLSPQHRPIPQLAGGFAPKCMNLRMRRSPVRTRAKGSTRKPSFAQGIAIDSDGGSAGLAPNALACGRFLAEHHERPSDLVAIELRLERNGGDAG